jgi:hypothetical protein
VCPPSVRSMDARNVVAASVALATSLALGPDAIAQPAPEPPHVRLAARTSAGAVERALAGALRRLERPTCQRLYAEFQDGAGRPLREALDGKGLSGPEHLASLIFYDGAAQPPCEREATLAFTFPGSPIVFVCSTQFVREWRRNPFLVEAALIHEGLHSLGLGENPPTSAAITSRVMNHCGQ